MCYGRAQEDVARSGRNPRWLMGWRGPSANRCKTHATYGCYNVVSYRFRRARSLVVVLLTITLSAPGKQSVSSSKSVEERAVADSLSSTNSDSCNKLSHKHTHIEK
ncbi:hypothetical protein ElyMa_004518300 [Elysia marginata]|uniref:Uncharacterized protein n=1 Tax=Elysia marginata TaxID=1093978 RepID=A0AAV4HLK8_9GAST|nr:hypothetical protein ElyMa_004518300 [Elysia marginata]